MEDNNERQEFLDGLDSLRIGDTDYKTKLTKTFINRVKYIKPNPKFVYSFIPGTIVEILTKKGKKVKKGEILLLLEAMKMRNQVLAPANGVIKEIHVNIGQTIPKNFLILELE
jgi:biotin carboxyl carrier protein